jgi:signal transduction histidine kinase
LKFPVYSLRTGILAQLVFLIVAAMLLINVVIVRLAERDLIRAKLDSGRLLAQAVEQNLSYFLQSGSGKLAEINEDLSFQKGVSRLLTHGGFSDVVIINADGERVFSTRPPGKKDVKALSLARESAATGLAGHRFSGSTWGVIWLSQENLLVSSPLQVGGTAVGGIAVAGSLRPVYQALRQSQKIILLYILLDTLILVMVGIVLLSRIVVKPIHQLLKLTAEYKEGYMVPSFGEASKNEIGELSRSLKNMLKRLDDNKRELKDHIASLETANQELKQAQDEIIRSEKLATVGRLAAGIAHEIGNPIGIVLGYLDLLESNDISREEKTDYLKRIESEVNRINQIIRQLLDFSRPSSGKAEEIPLHKVITKTVDMFEPQPMMEDIDIRLELRAEKDKVLADPNELQQVFLNIIMNAADALSAKNGSGLEKQLVVKTENVGDTIRLHLSDNGPGMSEGEIAHIFDPFFTTKDPGKGTGLGLSVCYRIVEGLGGVIRAESTQGRGMTVHITLPLMNHKERRGQD